MAEQQPASRIMMPSNGSAPDMTQRAFRPTENSHPPPAAIQQYYMQIHRQQQQQRRQQPHPSQQAQPPQQNNLQHQKQRLHHQAENVTPTQPMTTHAGQGQPSVPTYIHRPPNAESAHQLTTPQVQLSPPASSEHALRDQVISLLASNANGCIIELGYPALLQKHEHLSAEYEKLDGSWKGLQQENDGLKRDNFRLAQMLCAKDEEMKKRAEHDALIFQTLNARIVQSEKEQDLLRRQCRVLRQARTLDAPEAYKVLEDKYYYVLDILKMYHVPITIEDPNGANRIHRTNAENGKPMSNGQNVFVQGSSSRPLSMSGSAPPMFSQQHTVASSSVVMAPGLQKHNRSVSYPIPTPGQLSVSPTVQLFPKPASSSTGSSSGTSQQHAKSTQGHAQTVAQEHIAYPPIHIPAPIPASTVIYTVASTQSEAVPERAHLGEDKPRLQVKTTFEPKVHPMSLSLSPISTQIANAAGISMQQSGNAPPLTMTPEDASDQKTPHLPTSRSREQTPNSAPSPPNILTPKDTQKMEIDREAKTRADIEVEDQDIVMAEGETSGIKEVPSSELLGENETPMQVADGEEEEEEEAYDDLSDDEGGRKQPILDCISSIFYDDENDERLCTFCNAWLEKTNSSNSRPTFTECSIRELIMHGKKEHPLVWEKLRRA